MSERERALERFVVYCSCEQIIPAAPGEGTGNCSSCYGPYQDSNQDRLGFGKSERLFHSADSESDRAYGLTENTLKNSRYVLSDLRTPPHHDRGMPVVPSVFIMMEARAIPEEKSCG